MKYTRLIVGLLIIIASFYVVAREQISGTSSNAFVNAQVVTVRSEISGRLSLPHRQLGTAIAKGETIAMVSDPLVDAVRLHDLEMQKELLISRIEAIAARIDSVSLIRKAMDERTKTYREHRIAEIRARLERARKRFDILVGQESYASTQLQAAAAVGDDYNRFPGEPLLESLALQHAREKIEVLEISLAAALAGVFLGDGYNDAPNSQQRSNELTRDLAELSISLTAAKTDLLSIETRILKEIRNVNLMKTRKLSSPVGGIYWEALASAGVTVQRGDPVIRIIDCTTTFVSLSVSEIVYNSLDYGQPAKFRFMNDSRVYDGVVSRLGGSGAATIYRNLAIAPTKRHLERYDVTLTVPDLADDVEFACGVGRTGRVFFDSRPLDRLRQLFQ